MNIDAQDVAFNTPLHHAALTGKKTVCQYLIEQGANTTLTNRDDLLAIDLAQSAEVIEYLKQY